MKITKGMSGTVLKMSYCKLNIVFLPVSCFQLASMHWNLPKIEKAQDSQDFSTSEKRIVALAASWLLSQPISAMASGIWSTTPCLLELQRWVPPLRSSFCNCPMWEKATARLWPSQALSPWLLATTTSASSTPGLPPLSWDLRMATM